MRYIIKIKIVAVPVLLAAVFCQLMTAPALGLTVAEEKKLGEEFYKHARMTYDFIDDPFINHYVRKIGNHLVSFFPDQPFDLHFHVIHSNVYNAFAAPAGHVFMHSGLISAMDSEEELAGILAHEIAHVYCRHIAKKIESSKKISLATLAGIAAGVFLGNPAVAIGSIATGQAVNLAYSREDERQADQIGVLYLCRAGYSAQGLLSVLKKINARDWFTVYDIPSYLSTHPGTEERIAYLDTLLATHNFEFCRKHHQPDNAAFKLFHTKLTALYDDTAGAERRFPARLEKDDRDATAHYGYGLVLSKKARHQEAIDHLKSALATADDVHPEMIKALGRVYLRAGFFEQALDTLKTMPPTDWYDHEKQLLLAGAYEGVDRLSDSLSTLKDLLNRQPDNKEAHYAIGNIYGKKGRDRQAHYHLGIHHKAAHAPETALFHLRRTLSLTSDPEKKEMLEEMIRQVRQEQKRR